MNRKTFCSFIPSFKEARLTFQTPPEPPAPQPPKVEPPKPDDTAGRISDLSDKLKAEREEKKALSDKLKAIEDAAKADADEKLKKKGEFETLLKTRETELATANSAKTEYEGKLAKYEADAQKRIDESIKSITDPEKQKSAQAMLSGRPLEEQVALLPQVLQLAGQAAPATFGAPTPSSTSTPAKTEVDQDRKRYEELLAKKLPTPQEQRERHTLMVKLQKVWDAEQDKKLLAS